MNEINYNCELKTEKNAVTTLVSYETYGESYPQAILQAYTLWKRPAICLMLDYTNGKSIPLHMTFFNHINILNPKLHIICWPKLDYDSKSTFYF